MKGVGETVVSYLPIVTQDDNTDVVSLQVQSHTLDSGLELNHFSGLNLGQTKDSCNTISNGDNRSKFFQVILSSKSNVRSNQILILHFKLHISMIYCLKTVNSRRDLFYTPLIL